METRKDDAIRQEPVGSQELYPNAMQLGAEERLELALGKLCIGARVHEELNRQGRSVAWLARQLGKDRPNLYYFFDRNTIDAELLLRISYYLKHDFLQDVNEVCKAYGL